MGLDAVFIGELARELNAKLSDGRIDKVQMPQRDGILISARAQGENRRLVISAAVGSARAHLTAESFENPAQPPMFCMLLRKHLVGARIVSVSQPERERMLIMELDTRDEMGVAERKRLVIELMGRASNIILVSGGGNIIDCLRRVDFGETAARRLLPGMLYRMQTPLDKPNFFELSSGQRRELWEKSAGGEADKRLTAAFSGLSPLIARELAHRSRLDPETMPEIADALCESVAAGECAPYMLLRDGQAFDFSFMPISQYGGDVVCEERAGFSELLDEFYTKREKAEAVRLKAKNLTHSVKTARDRTARKLAARREELVKTRGREQLRRNAELLTANLYRLKKGESVLICEDYYAEGSPQIEIALDPLKTPQQNAAAMYKQYNKLKTAESYLRGLIEENEKQLQYLESVLDELSRAGSERDIGDIRLELEGTGFLKKRSGSKKPEKNKAQGPLRYRSSEGLEILVGRSNAMNDELTFKTARRTDFWLHARRIHGSHVIIRCEGETPPPATLSEAASLAAMHSQAGGGGKIPVDCTMVRNVKKPSGAMPGFVVYEEYLTLMAEADAQLEQRLKIK